MLKDGQGTQRRRKIAENSNRLSRVTNVTDDRRRTTTYSEREREFTFAKKYKVKKIL